MKKKYIAPSSEAISLMTGESVLLTLSKNESEATQLSNGKGSHSGGWNSSDWSDSSDE